MFSRLMCVLVTMILNIVNIITSHEVQWKVFKYLVSHMHIRLGTNNNKQCL